VTLNATHLPLPLATVLLHLLPPLKLLLLLLPVQHRC
jgi:hypothetical protein